MPQFVISDSNSGLQAASLFGATGAVHLPFTIGYGAGSTTVPDVSTNNYTAGFTGAQLWDRNTPNNAALIFNNRHSVSSAYYAPTDNFWGKMMLNQSTAGGPGNNSFSISFWMLGSPVTGNYSNLELNNALIMKGLPATGNPAWAVYCASTGGSNRRWSAYISTVTGSEGLIYCDSDSTTAISTTVFNHYVILVDRSDTANFTISVYLNNTLITTPHSQPSIHTSGMDNTSKLTIGIGGTYTNGIRRMFTDFWFIPRIITATEINSLYRALA